MIIIVDEGANEIMVFSAEIGFGKPNWNSVQGYLHSLSTDVYGNGMKPLLFPAMSKITDLIGLSGHNGEQPVWEENNTKWGNLFLFEEHLWST